MLCAIASIVHRVWRTGDEVWYERGRGLNNHETTQRISMVVWQNFDVRQNLTNLEGRKLSLTNMVFDE